MFQAVLSEKVLPDSGFVRLPAILKVFPVSRSTWWSGVSSGKYPSSVKLSERVTAWKVEDIRALIEKFNDGAAA